MNDNLEQELLDLLKKEEELQEDIAERKAELLLLKKQGKIELNSFAIIQKHTRDFSECGHPEYDGLVLAFESFEKKYKEVVGRIKNQEKYLSSIETTAIYTLKEGGNVTLQAPTIVKTTEYLKRK